MFVDLDWPTNASNPLSASAELLVPIGNWRRRYNSAALPRSLWSAGNLACFGISMPSRYLWVTRHLSVLSTSSSVSPPPPSSAAATVTQYHIIRRVHKVTVIAVCADLINSTVQLTLLTFRTMAVWPSSSDNPLLGSRRGYFTSLSLLLSTCVRSEEHTSELQSR